MSDRSKTVMKTKRWNKPQKRVLIMHRKRGLAGPFAQCLTGAKCIKGVGPYRDVNGPAAP